MSNISIGQTHKKKFVILDRVNGAPDPNASASIDFVFVNGGLDQALTMASTIDPIQGKPGEFFASIPTDNLQDQDQVSVLISSNSDGNIQTAHYDFLVDQTNESAIISEVEEALNSVNANTQRNVFRERKRSH